MDSLIGLKGKDFVIIAADTINAYSVLRMKVPFHSLRTMMIKFGTLMEKNFSQSEESTQIFSSLEIIFKKILLSSSTKMGINCQLMTLLSSSDQNLRKPSGKDLIVSTVFSLDLKVMSPDFIGWTTLAQLLSLLKLATDMLNF